MRVCAISGGVGSARFCAGLQQVVDTDDLTIVVNTGDDERIRGLHVSPDVDTVLYHLAGATDWERGWGISGESFVANDRYRSLVASLGEIDVDLQDWFSLGDLDLATHLLRARLLDLGWPLSRATDALRRAFGIGPTVLPMSDDVVRTKLTTSSGELLDFQTYFVRQRHASQIASVAFEGASTSAPAPGVLDAIEGASVVVIPPSNPLLSIAPVLAVPGLRAAMASSTAVRVGVSPIVGGKAIKGPADALMASLGHDVSAVGVARIYEGLIDVFVLDAADATCAGDVEELGMRVVVCDTMMTGASRAAELAREVLERAAP